MYRLAQLTLFVLFGAFVVGLWWTHITPPDPPSKVTLPGQSAPATVAWSPDSPVVQLNANSDGDAARALGVAHGMRHGWTMVLWRQAARGQLTEWLPDDALGLDRHARQMGWTADAESRADTLSDEAYRWLSAYADGVNTALTSDHVRQHPALVALNLEPEPWAPWHTLAVEHMLTWLTTAVPDLPPHPTSTMQHFREVDADFRAWMRLHGFTHSMAWALPHHNHPDSTALGYRLTYGDTSDPFVMPVAHTTPHGTAWTATVPGTRWMLAHHTESTDHLTLPADTATWQRTPATPSPRTERIQTHAGHETLVSITHTATGRLFDATPDDIARDSTLADSTWMLTLPHRAAPPAPDAHFPAVSTPPHPAGHHLKRTAHEPWSASEGAPTTAIRSAAGDSLGVLMSASPWRPMWSNRLHAYIDQNTPRHRWAVDDTSAWAAEQVQPLNDALDTYPPSHSIAMEAQSFLDNWEGVYNPSSIGASLFTQWWHEIEALRSSPTALDTTIYFADVQYRRAFDRAVAQLTADHGPDVYQWRWEAVAPHQLSAPLWGAPETHPPNIHPDAAHPAPHTSVPGRSHISTLAPGPSLHSGPPAPSYALHGAVSAAPPWYRTTDPNRTLADRLSAGPDARATAYFPPTEPSVRIQLRPPS